MNKEETIKKEIDIFYSIAPKYRTKKSLTQCVSALVRKFNIEIIEEIIGDMGEERGVSPSYSHPGSLDQKFYENRNGRGYDLFIGEYLDIIQAKNDGYNQKVAELKKFKKNFIKKR